MRRGPISKLKFLTKANYIDHIERMPYCLQYDPGLNPSIFWYAPDQVADLVAQFEPFVISDESAENVEVAHAKGIKRKPAVALTPPTGELFNKRLKFKRTGPPVTKTTNARIQPQPKITRTTHLLQNSQPGGSGTQTTAPTVTNGDRPGLVRGANPTFTPTGGPSTSTSATTPSAAATLDLGDIEAVKYVIPELYENLLESQERLDEFKTEHREYTLMTEVEANSSNTQDAVLHQLYYAFLKEKNLQELNKIIEADATLKYLTPDAREFYNSLFSNPILTTIYDFERTLFRGASDPDEDAQIRLLSPLQHLARPLAFDRGIVLREELSPIFQSTPLPPFEAIKQIGAVEYVVKELNSENKTFKLKRANEELWRPDYGTPFKVGEYTEVFAGAPGEPVL